MTRDDGRDVNEESRVLESFSLFADDSAIKCVGFNRAIGDVYVGAVVADLICSEICSWTVTQIF